MSIPKSLFNKQCIDFVNKSCCHGWNILARELNGPIRLPVQDDLNLADDRDLMLVKDEIRYNDKTRQVLNYEYNVIYSEAYGTPVMYFNISDQSKF